MMFRISLIGFGFSAFFYLMFWLATWTNFFGGGRLRTIFKNTAIGIAALSAAVFGLGILFVIDNLS